MVNFDSESGREELRSLVGDQKADSHRESSSYLNVDDKWAQQDRAAIEAEATRRAIQEGLIRQDGRY